MTSLHRDIERGRLPSPDLTPRDSSITVARPQPTQEEASRQPSRWVGYGGYSKFISSDDDLFILRRFSALSVRVALSMQHEIATLEKELENLDRSYAMEEPTVHNGCFEDDQEDREMLLRIIAEKLRRYNKFILQQSTLRTYKSAPQESMDGLLEWHQAYQGNAIDREEQTYLRTGEDLISVVQQSPTTLHQLIEGTLHPRWPRRRWGKGKGASPSCPRTGYPKPRKRVDALASLLLALIGAVMIIAPIWVLQIFGDARKQIIVATVFVGVLLAVLSVSMMGKPLHVLGASAVYAAVLMSFVK